MRTCKIVDFAVPVVHRVKLKENEKKDRELKKTMEHEGDDNTNRDLCFWYNHQRISKGTGGLGGWRPSKLQHYWKRPEYWEESY